MNFSQSRPSPRLPWAVLMGASLLAGGCAGRPSLIPNSDPALRKASTQFAAEAVAHYPYKGDAERGATQARAEIEYGIKQVRLLNGTDQDWSDVELWVNQKYVVFLPKVPSHTVKHVNFQMLYDDKGNYFPISLARTPVKKVEVYRDGKMFDVPVALAE